MNRCEHHRRCEHRCSRADPIILPAGGHDYPFQYKLPDKLPSSFESQDVCKGRVHYQLRARIDSPDDSIRQNKDRVFLVLSALDLNKEPRASVSLLSLILVVNICKATDVVNFWSNLWILSAFSSTFLKFYS